MINLFIDAGGTSFKYEILIDNELKISKHLEGSNISSNFSKSIENLKTALSHFDKYDNVIIGIAGFKRLPEDKKREFTSILNDKSLKFEVLSDAHLPLFETLDPNVVSIISGTGTSITFKDEGEISSKILMGFGFAIGDIGSGFDIGQHILLESLIKNKQDVLNEISELLNCKTDEIIGNLYSNLNLLQSNIASIARLNVSENKEIRDFANGISFERQNKLIGIIKNDINPNMTIVLNGGVFKNQAILNLYKDEFSKNKIVVSKGNALQAAKNYLKSKEGVTW